MATLADIGKKDWERQTMRVLVVDDELGIREGCRRALTPKGFEVEVAENGPSGLHKLRDESFDILLVDAMMPGMSGLEMLRHARKLYPELICIIITGFATIELAVQAMREGAHDFVSKPFTPTLLLQVINRELDRRRLKHEAQRVKDLEEELRGLTQAKTEMEKLSAIESRFMLTMVHILRAPVAVMQNSVQLIQKGYVPAEEFPKVLSRLDLRAGELLAILEDILVLSRLKEGLGPRTAEPVSVAEVVDSVCSSFQADATKSQLTISKEVADNPFFRGNPDHLRVLWSQLVSNAIRYTPEGGHITLSLKTNPQKGQIEGAVSDDGIGIAPEEIPRIFEEFYRTEAAKSMKETGTGLGLPIVQQVLSLYGGEIAIDSIPGRGSSFRFTLPLFNPESGAIS